MSRREPIAVLPSGTADAVLDALPHPVITVGVDWRIVSANAAAESFFEFCRRHDIAALRDLAERAPLKALAA